MINHSETGRNIGVKNRIASGLHHPRRIAQGAILAGIITASTTMGADARSRVSAPTIDSSASSADQQIPMEKIGCVLIPVEAHFKQEALLPATHILTAKGNSAGGFDKYHIAQNQEQYDEIALRFKATNPNLKIPSVNDKNNPNSIIVDFNDNKQGVFFSDRGEVKCITEQGESAPKQIHVAIKKNDGVIDIVVYDRPVGHPGNYSETEEPSSAFTN